MPGFCLLANYNGSVGINASNTKLNAVTDPEFTQDGNSNWKFTEDYKLYAASLVGASVTKGRFQAPHWNAWAEFDIFSANRNAGPPSNPFVDWYSLLAPPVPKYESFEVDVSGNLGAATEIDSAFLCLMAADGFWPLPTSGIPFLTTFTFTVTPTAGAWSAPQAITFTQSLRGGVYSVIGCVLQGANSDYFRWIFPRYRMYNGRRLRPGWMLQGAIGNVPSLQLQDAPGRFGEWGRFWTQELPQLEVLGRTASSTTYTGFVWLVYLGEDQSLVTQGSGGGAYASGAALAA